MVLPVWTTVVSLLKYGVISCSQKLPEAAALVFKVVGSAHALNATRIHGDLIETCMSLITTSHEDCSGAFQGNMIAECDWTKLFTKANLSFELWSDSSLLTFNGNKDIHFTQSRIIRESPFRKLLSDISIL